MKKIFAIILSQLIISSNLLPNGKVIFKNKTKQMYLDIKYEDTSGETERLNLKPGETRTKTTNQTGALMFKSKADIKDMEIDVWYKDKNNGNYRGKVEFKKNVRVDKDEDTYVYFKYDVKKGVPLRRRVKITGKDKDLENYGEEGKSNASIKVKNETDENIKIQLKNSEETTLIKPDSEINVCLPYNEDLIFGQNIKVIFKNKIWQWKNRYRIGKDVPVKIEKNRKTNIIFKKETVEFKNNNLSGNILLREIKFDNKTIEKVEDSIPRSFRI
jgi:hypothetical protein